jgi:hypothetical protein
MRSLARIMEPSNGAGSSPAGTALDFPREGLVGLAQPNQQRKMQPGGKAGLPREQ